MKKTLFRIATMMIVAIIFFFEANAQTEVPEEMKALLTKHTCVVCHDLAVRKVGPAYKDVAKKKYTTNQIVELIYNPKPEHWPGYPPMAPMQQVPKEDALKLATWINSLDRVAKKSPILKNTSKKS